MAIIGVLPYNLTNGTTGDASQVMADFAFIVAQVNANAVSSGAIVPSTQNARTLTATGGSTPLVNTDGYVLISNTTAPLALVPPGAPGTNQLVTIKDAGGTAGNFPFSFTGTIDGVVNPTLTDVSYGVAQILFSGGLVYRIF